MKSVNWKEPATMEDVFNYYLESRKFTDRVRLRANIAIGCSVASVLMALGIIAIRLF